MAVADGFHVDTNGNLWLGSNRRTFDSTTQSEAKFYVEADGTMVAKAGATFAGDLSAAGGTFSGNLSAAGGTFTGNLSAAGGTFSGDISGASGTFTGDLTGADISGGTINIGSGTFQVDSSGNLTATSATITGSVTATSGTIGGISINSGDIQGSYTSGSAGFRIQSNGTAEFNGPILKFGKAVGTPTTTNSIQLGDAQLFSRDEGSAGNHLFSTKPFVVMADGSEDNPSLTIQGDYEKMGFFLISTTEFGGFDRFKLSNGDDDIWSVSSNSTDFTILGNLSVQGSTLTVNGDSGGNNEFLGYNSSGTLGFHSVSTGSHNHDGDYVDTVSGSTDALSISGRNITLNFGSTSTRVARGNHNHDGDYATSSGITSINSQTGSSITLTSGFSNSGQPYVGVGGFSSNSNTISLGRSTQARCNILDPHSTSPKVGNSTSDRFSNIYSQSFFGTFYGQNINASSRNIKENIEDTSLGLDFINDLTVKDFTMIDTDTFGTKKYTGFIAEDIEDYLTENNLDYKLTETYKDNYEFKDKCSHIVYCENDNFNCEEDCCSEYFRRDRGEGIVELYLHETVEDCEAYMPDENRHPHLYFNNFIGPLVKAVQELSAKNDELESRLAALEG